MQQPDPAPVSISIDCVIAPAFGRIVMAPEVHRLDSQSNLEEMEVCRPHTVTHCCAVAFAVVLHCYSSAAEQIMYIMHKI